MPLLLAASCYVRSKAISAPNGSRPFSLAPFFVRRLATCELRPAIRTRLNCTSLHLSLASETSEISAEHAVEHPVTPGPRHLTPAYHLAS